MFTRASVARFIFLLSIVLAVSVQAHADDEGHLAHIEGTDPEEDVQVVQPELDFVQPDMMFLASAAPATSLRVSLERLTGFDAPLKRKLEEAQRLLNRVFASTSFYNAVKSHQFQRSLTFANADGLSNAQIYDKIQLGKEKLSGVIDRKMNLHLKSYYENSSTVGYTYTNSQIIHVNLKFYRGYSAAQIARNLTHEWLHKIGFSHDASVTSRRPYSVPYAVGEIVEKLGRN